MNRKKAFTLLELMVTLFIFSILSIMISAILIQSQKILKRVDNGALIQDEVRIALLKIQTEAQNSDEVIINNKFGSFNGNQWIIDNSNSSSRELLRFINEQEDTAKVYVEVNDGNKHQLIEFTINKTNNQIIDNSKNILISNIEGSNANAITLDVEEINDSNGNKINELVTINCSNIISGSKVNDSEYLISFTRSRENVINVNVGNNSESGSGDEETNELLKFESMVTQTWNNGGEWKFTLTNNTKKDIKAWSIIVSSNRPITIWGGWGKIEDFNSNLFKIYNDENSWKALIKSGETIDIQGNYTGEIGLIMNITNYEYVNK